MFAHILLWNSRVTYISFVGAIINEQRDRDEQEESRDSGANKLRIVKIHIAQF